MAAICTADASPRMMTPNASAASEAVISWWWASFVIALWTLIVRNAVI